MALNCFYCEYRDRCNSKMQYWCNYLEARLSKTITKKWWCGYYD